MDVVVNDWLWDMVDGVIGSKNPPPNFSRKDVEMIKARTVQEYVKLPLDHFCEVSTHKQCKISSIFWKEGKEAISRNYMTLSISNIFTSLN